MKGDIKPNIQFSNLISLKKKKKQKAHKKIL